MTSRKDVIIVGGSVAGLACAHALLKAGCNVTVLERSITIAAAGAGLGLDHKACEVLSSFGLGQDLLENSCPLDVELDRVVVRPEQSGQDRTAEELFRDEQYAHRSAHWSDLHWMLRKGLPDGVINLGHDMVSFETIADGQRVRVTAEVGPARERRTYEGDLLVAADGAMSEARAQLVPEDVRRYSGYCAWRGVLTAHHELCTEEEQAVVADVRAAYPELGKAIYFDMARGSHAVLYELPNHRLNWLWYVTQPQPKLRGPSVIVTAKEKALHKLHMQADETWPKPLAQLMKVTAAPYIHAIFDKDPLSRYVWGRTVLVGDAAHPTTPHGLRSTNMALVDAATLGRCIGDCQGDLDAGLAQYESERLSLTAREAMFSRCLGQLKQGLLECPPASFDWTTAGPEVRQSLGAKGMAEFDHQHFSQDPPAFGPNCTRSSTMQR